MYKNKEDFNEYQKIYYFVRRQNIIKTLGKKCFDCGYNGPIIFVCGYNAKSLYGKPIAWFKKNKAKFKLLCADCKGKSNQKLNHGTYYGYRKHKCRCELCVAANNKQQAKLNLYRKEKRANAKALSRKAA